MKPIFFFYILFCSFLGLTATHTPEWVSLGGKWLKVAHHTRPINRSVFSIRNDAQPVAILKVGSTPQEVLIYEIMQILGLQETVPPSFLVKDLQIPQWLHTMVTIDNGSITPDIMNSIKKAIDSDDPLLLENRIVTWKDSVNVLEKPVIFMSNLTNPLTLSLDLQRILKETEISDKEGASVSLQELSLKISPESFSFFQKHLNKDSVHKAFLYYFITNAHDLYKRNILIDSDGKEFFVKCIDHDQTLEIKKDKDQQIGIIGDRTDVFGLSPIDSFMDPSLCSLILSWDLDRIRSQLIPLFHQAHVSLDKLEALLSRIQALKTVVTLSKGKILPRNLDTLASLLVETTHESPPGLLVEDKLGDSYHVSWLIKGNKMVSSDIVHLPLIENCLKRDGEVNGKKYSGWLLLKLIIKYNKDKINVRSSYDQKMKKWLEIIDPYLDTTSPLYAGLIEQIPLLKKQEFLTISTPRIRPKPPVPPKPTIRQPGSTSVFSPPQQSKPPILAPRPRNPLAVPNDDVEEFKPPVPKPRPPIARKPLIPQPFVPHRQQEAEQKETEIPSKVSVKDLIRKFSQ